MVARATIVKFLVAFAALVVLAFPNDARAHGGHDHAPLVLKSSAPVHAPASIVKRLMNTDALIAITAEVDEIYAVSVSARADDTHDCAERGCDNPFQYGSVGTALAASYPLVLTDHAQSALVTAHIDAPAGILSVYDGPPPKVLA
ncbi:hypothetical protein GJW-30_1_00581 [Variibacter gotjawalensis]|uniref:Uncharacterized protein n=1 Tax=Variibacter gotjawalensis TaxID=1333996 RepID=A0A0S3PQA6_9BRAD|nr:hypothetical protein [Variibacter gotjawalensis]NIK48367.1 hypothetical protein [Variibacter gotjawalensis]RZS50234.1 hypothetical protein EV661_2690 [Variibacter gotjawalensis]BAT58067.1 hypothetical protein GJW-30_1_00581 [Variibacter gotjawalensis]